MKLSSNLKSLLSHPSFTASQARKMGISSRKLSYYCKKGLIERIAHGVYRNPATPRDDDNFQWIDLLEIASSIPNGVICLISALAYYEMTVERTQEFWIAIPHEAKAPKRPLTRIIRMRNTKLGRVPLEIGGFSTHIFDRERCVIDAFRHLSEETAIHVLRSYLRATDSHKPDYRKLAHYARALRANIGTYIKAITA
jgi:predicted transcriptional regulator of viral defense system